MNILNRKSTVTDHPAFNIRELEAEIAEELKKDKKSQLEQLAEYAPNPAQQVSRLTSEAVMAQHEQAAEAIKEMAATVTSLAKEHENALNELDAMGKLITETAGKFMTLGRERSELIARSAKIMADVKQTCADVMTKIDGDNL